MFKTRSIIHTAVRCESQMTIDGKRLFSKSQKKYTKFVLKFDQFSKIIYFSTSNAPCQTLARKISSMSLKMYKPTKNFYPIAMKAPCQNIESTVEKKSDKVQNDSQKIPSTNFSPKNHFFKFVLSYILVLVLLLTNTHPA